MELYEINYLKIRKIAAYMFYNINCKLTVYLSVFFS